MDIDYTVTALMFPAIPLIMGVYSNRFHTLSNLIRKIHDEHVFEKHTPPEWKNQLINLNDRIGVLKLTIMFSAFGFLFLGLLLFESAGLFLLCIFVYSMVYFRFSSGLKLFYFLFQNHPT